jgi:hypothetical protein
LAIVGLVELRFRSCATARVANNDRAHDDHATRCSGDNADLRDFRKR